MANFHHHTRGDLIQTFLPFADFAQSARVLDRQRLGKQRVENMQILSALMTGKGWVNHPATLMWRRYEWALMRYQFYICREWTDRGYKDTCLEKSRIIYETNLNFEPNKEWPNWLGTERFHISHQSNLMRKDRVYYSQYFPGVPDYMEYVWPTQDPDLIALGPSPWWECTNPPLF